LYGGLHPTTGYIRSGGELLTLLRNGKNRNGQTQFFTYVIVKDTWRFSETGVSRMKDFSSKHATHSGCAESVDYAGEFHFQPCDDRPNSYKLIIDNNSGTYAPSSEMLVPLRKLMQRNFPGLEVEALDFKDPTLKMYITRAKQQNQHIQNQRLVAMRK